VSAARALRTALPAAAPILAVAAVYVLTLCLIEKRGFWVVDNAEKYLQLRAIATSGYRQWSIPWPGKSIDPGFAYNPLPYAFSQVKDGELYPVFSPLFAAISSLPFRLFGFPGLYVIPLLASLGMLGGVARLAAILGAGRAGRAAAVLLAGVCTPIWFYSVTFWEHTLAACFCVWAVALHLDFRRSGRLAHGLGAAAFAAFSVYWRDELYLFCLAVLGTHVLFGPRRGVALLQLPIMALCLVPLWLFQSWSIGEPFGFHIHRNLLASEGLAAHLAARPRAFYNLLAASGPHVGLSLVASAPFLIPFAWLPRFTGRSFVRAVPLLSLAAAAASAATLIGYWRASSPIVWLDSANSLFNTTPILVLAFLRRGERAGADPTRWLWTLALFFIFLYGMAAPELATKGLHWGNRYLLVLYPLFAALAGRNLVEWWCAPAGTHLLRGAERPGGARRPWRRAAVLLALLVALAAQVYSVDLLHRKQTFTRRLNAAIGQRPEPAVVTDVPWAAAEMHEVFYAKPIFFVRSQAQLEQLMRKLEARGVGSAAFVTQGTPDVPDAATTRIDDFGLGFFALQIFGLDLGATP
jgi:hypothetical protein